MLDKSIDDLKAKNDLVEALLDEQGRHRSLAQLAEDDVAANRQANRNIQVGCGVIERSSHGDRVAGGTKILIGVRLPWATQPAADRRDADESLKKAGDGLTFVEQICAEC